MDFLKILKEERARARKENRAKRGWVWGVGCVEEWA